MSSDCRIGTPDRVRTLRVRENRERAALWKSTPKIGTLSLNLSQVSLPLGVTFHFLNAQAAPIAMRPNIQKYVLNASDTASRILVGRGSTPPRLEYRSLKVGTTNRSIAARISVTMTNTTIG